jgi:hypothetical protein
MNGTYLFKCPQCGYYWHGLMFSTCPYGCGCMGVR